MRILAPLVALLAVVGCANPEDYRRGCVVHAQWLHGPRSMVRPDPAVLAERQEREVTRCMEREASLERGRQAAPILGIVFGAGAAALSEHNFFVYDVPRAGRYLRR